MSMGSESMGSERAESLGAALTIVLMTACALTPYDECDVAVSTGHGSIHVKVTHKRNGG